MIRIFNYLKIKKSRKNIIEYSIIIWVIFSSGSVMFFNHYSLYIIVSTFLLMIIYLKNRYYKKLKVELILSLIGIFIIIFITMITNTSIIYSTYFGLVLRILQVFFIVQVIQFSNYKKRYINCITILAVISIVFYMIGILSPNIVSNLPTIYNSEIRPYKNAFVYAYRFSYYTGNIAHLRNGSIFWEPGAYQSFLNLALFFEITNIRRRKWVIITLLITILTTLSTTGIIVGVIILIVFLLKKIYSTKIRILIQILIIILLFSNIFADVVVNKLMNESSRTQTAIVDMKIIEKHPLVGIGYENYYNQFMKYKLSYSSAVQSNSITSNIAIFGIFFFIIIFRGYMKFSINILKMKYESMVLLLLLMMIFLAENLLLSTSFLSLAFYGMSGDKL